MKEKNKVLLKTFLLSGLVFASTMAVYGYLINDNHIISKFIFHFLLFGIGMGLVARKNYRKKLKEDSNR